MTHSRTNQIATATIIFKETMDLINNAGPLPSDLAVSIGMSIVACALGIDENNKNEFGAASSLLIQRFSSDKNVEFKTTYIDI